jgi:hypothetical protein
VILKSFFKLALLPSRRLCNPPLHRQRLHLHGRHQPRLRRTAQLMGVYFYSTAGAIGSMLLHRQYLFLSIR